MKTPDSLKILAEQFNSKKHTLYAVGGFVRDSILNQNPIDIDITSSMKIDDVLSLCQEFNYKCKTVNKNLGTLLITIDDNHYEYTTFRKESYSNKGEHSPDGIVFVDDIETDAKRRDLTINAIYYDIHNDKIVDPCNGLNDINKKIIRTTQSPDIILNDDGLRILRIIRFASTLNFKFDKTTLKGLINYKARLNKISKERILKELEQLVVCDLKYNNHNHVFLNMINKLNLLENIFNRSFSQKRKFSKKDISKFYSLPKESRLIGLYILILKNHFTGLTSDDQILFTINTLLGPDGIKDRKDNISITNKLFKIYQNLEYDNDIIAASINYLTLSDSERIIITTFLSTKPNLALSVNISTIKASKLPLSVHDLDIEAKDLIEAGIENIHISKILSQLFSKVIEMKVKNKKEDLISLAKEFEQSIKLNK